MLVRLIEDLEPEYQAAEIIVLTRRNFKSLEDLYAQLLEKRNMDALEN